MAKATDVLGRGILNLAEDAARIGVALPAEAIVGAQALHEWARGVLAQGATGT